jgi:hypothetical protein
MDNPNVASGKSSTPNQLDTVGGPFKLSNSDAVTGTTYAFGKQSDLAGQPSMVPQGSRPAFEKLAPKNMSIAVPKMGTDYQP